MMTRKRKRRPLLPPAALVLIPIVPASYYVHITHASHNIFLSINCIYPYHSHVPLSSIKPKQDDDDDNCITRE
jgi:hypothetical protein